MAGLFFDTEKMKEGVSAESEANGFQGNDLLWGDVAKVYICAQEFDKPNLLGLLRRLPDDFFERDFRQDFLYETRPNFTRRAKKTYISAL